MAAAKRPSVEGIENDAYINDAYRLSEILQKSDLHIVASSSHFAGKVKEFQDQDPTSNRTPAAISRNVVAHTDFLRKLKYHFLEQYAKDRYVATIVNDDAVIVTGEENNSLRTENEERKQRLKASKTRLAERQKQLRELGQSVYKDYSSLESTISEANALSQQILDTRLAITRLRTSHPHPRMTVAKAQSMLDSQTEAMANYEEQIADTSALIDDIKARVQDSARDVERTRNARQEKEREVSEMKTTEDADERVVSLYDWLSASLHLHRTIFSLHSVIPVSSNELALAYQLPIATNSTKLAGVTITLLFQPHTRQIADVQVSSTHPPFQIPTEGICVSYLPTNDVPGLLDAILLALRSKTGLHDRN